MASFSYHHLAMMQPERQIRLLHVQPGNDEAEIRVELKVFDFENSPPYVAISYTWGDEQPTIAIELNDHVYRVRMNCWYALWQMRHHQERRPIWIDSICIDQNNLSEKNVQVAKMGKIYSRATMTACCLGPGRNLAAAQKLSRLLTFNDTSRTFLAEKDLVRELQHKPYFRRMWIKQELILSEHIRLFCGVDHLDWDDYVQTLDIFVAHDLQNLSGRLEQHPKSRDLGNNVHKVLVEGRKAHRAIVQGNSEASGHLPLKPTPWAELWGLLEQYGDAECQDPHDKVFALVSLLPATSQIDLGLKIDYSLSPMSLCLEVVDSYLAESLSPLQEDPNLQAVPVWPWYTMSKLVQYWIRPRLSDALNSGYTARWSTMHEPATNEPGQGDCPMKIARTSIFVPMDVWYQFPIRGHIGSLPRTHTFFDYYAEDDTVGNDSESFATFYGSKEGLYISDTMPAGRVKDFILEIMRHNPTDYRPAFGERRDEYYLSALPPNTQVKLVAFNVRMRSMYLVSPNVDVGDELLVCLLDDPRVEQWFLPVVRGPREDYDASPSETSSPYSIVSGWTLYLDWQGTLWRKLPAEYADPDNDEQADVQDSAFHFYYEDLILDALLRQDPSAYLTHPRTHRQHPSFLLESSKQGEEEPLSLPAKQSCAEEEEAEESDYHKKVAKKGKKSVGFA